MTKEASGHARGQLQRLKCWLLGSEKMLKCLADLIRAIAALVRAWKGGGPA